MTGDRPEIRVNAEAIGETGMDLLAKLQGMAVGGLMKRQRAELAALTSDEIAWLCYPPMASDDPAEYAAHWRPLKSKDQTK